MDNIIDISREMLSAPVYPGQPAPKMQPTSSMKMGDAYNESVLYACLHSGTHLDAPTHFVFDGQNVDEIPLDACMGECSVIEMDGMILGSDIENRLWGLRKKILFKGKNVAISPSAASELTYNGVELVGVEGTSVAIPKETAEVHRQLLGGGTLILEGLDLSEVKEGVYYLIAVPLKIRGAEASPVRAVLLSRKV